MASSIPRCHFYGSRSGCYHGDRCRFLHVQDVDVNQNKPKQRKSACRYFGTARGCRFGDRCFYRHDIDSSLQVIASAPDYPEACMEEKYAFESTEKDVDMKTTLNCKPERHIVLKSSSAIMRDGVGMSGLVMIKAEDDVGVGVAGMSGLVIIKAEIKKETEDGQQKWEENEQGEKRDSGKENQEQEEEYDGEEEEKEEDGEEEKEEDGEEEEEEENEGEGGEADLSDQSWHSGYSEDIGSGFKKLVKEKQDRCKPEVTSITCRCCGDKFHGEDSFEHMLTHYRENLLKFSAPHVQFLKWHGGFQEPTHCLVCEKFFARSRDLLRHIADKAKGNAGDKEDHLLLLELGVVQPLSYGEAGEKHENVVKELLNCLAKPLVEFDSDSDEEYLAFFKHVAGMGGGLSDDDSDCHYGNPYGFDDDDCYELLCQGIKPWESIAPAALGVLYGL